MTTHAAAANKNGVVVASTFMKPTMAVMAIQPRVPIIRIGGKGACQDSSRCRIVIALVSAMVGK